MCILSRWPGNAIMGGKPNSLPWSKVMSLPNPYIRIDEHGVYRVGNTRVMLDSVVAGFLDSESPEFIRQQYPSLTLEQVYGSIAYYLGHREEIDAYLRRQD